MNTVKEYLESKDSQFKQSGSEWLTKCIFCSDEGSHLSVNNEKGVWHCWICGEAGNIWKLKKHFGDIDIVKIMQDRTYKVPAKGVHDNYHQALFSHQQALTFLRQERGFKDITIKHFKLGYSDGYISIPYIKDNKCVNIKYRKIDKKTFKRENDCESTLFNIDNIDRKQSLIVVEGEFDCIAAWQIGIKNVVSVSTGVEGINDNWIGFFDNFQKIYIVYDNEEKGDHGALKLSKRLDSICYRVKLPLKDFNDCLMAGYTKDSLKSYFYEAKEYKEKTVIHVSQVCLDLEKLYHEGEKTKGLQVRQWGKFNKILGGIRDCETTIITGDTGTGKTTWAINILYQLIQEDHAVLIFSSEMPNKIILRKMFSIYSRKAYYNFEKHELNRCLDYFTTKKIFFVKGDTNIKGSRISEIIEYGKKRLDIKYVLIDHLHHYIPLGTNDRVQEIEEFMRVIKQVNMKTGVHIFIIAHPHMLKDKSGFVTMNDIKGASAIKQDTDNVISVWRDKDKPEKNTLEVSFQKVRDDSGKEGVMDFLFDMDSQYYYENEDIY